jgi:hypothetical protein
VFAASGFAVPGDEDRRMLLQARMTRFRSVNLVWQPRGVSLSATIPGNQTGIPVSFERCAPGHQVQEPVQYRCSIFWLDARSEVGEYLKMPKAGKVPATQTPD